MSSRKTYFGIGWKDPNDPESGAPGKSDAEDRSAPTVVDDEKVAEGLRQLRSWYQAGTPEKSESDLSPAATPSPGESSFGTAHARPTAVGHATGSSAASQQRPAAPDPMRATMYGHDVHQFDFERPPADSAPPQATPAPTPSTALVLASASSAREQQELRQQLDGAPEGAPRSPSGSFQLASQKEAQRLQRPPGLRRSSHDVAPRPTMRRPAASHVMFGVGIAALVAAVLIWLSPDSGPDSAAASAPPRAPASLSTGIPSATAIHIPAPPAASQRTAPSVTAVEQRPAGPGRPTVPATFHAPTPAPVTTLTPALVAPKAERTSAPSIAKPRRPREPKPEVVKSTDDEVAALAMPGKEPDKTPPADAIAPPDRPVPTRKKVAPAGAKGSEQPDRDKTRSAGAIGDADETLPPSED
jgi:hypothetical protein